LAEERLVDNFFDHNEPRQRSWVLIVSIIIVLLVIVFGAYLVWKVLLPSDVAKVTEKAAAPKELPRMANLPPKKVEPAPAPPSYPVDAPLLEQVREAMRKGITPDEAVAMAKSLPEKPERADAAFILLEYAAEAGHPEAALNVGRYFDPNSKSDSGTIIKDPAAAYEWYQLAVSKGRPEAKNHLSELKHWLEDQAAQGSNEARELLNEWD